LLVEKKVNKFKKTLEKSGVFFYICFMNNMNSVQLVGWYGGDKAIARAAWTSTQIDVDTKTDEQIRDLLVNKLWNNGSGKPHKTPFERGIVEFNITCEQASHIHLLKHRLANINGESARYKELKEDKYYLPEDLGWNQEMKTTNMSWVEKLAEFTEEGNKLYHQCLEELTPILGRKRAKESARFFKTMNSQLTLSVMMNMSCFSNFYTLRHDEAAQKEIQWIAGEMLECVKNIEGKPFQHSLAAFGF
jgi:flavin-dependent thymidylate synthase